MARRLPPLNALRAFEAAGRHLSFTKAAAELHVTHAAISHQVRALEEHLGVPLFRRLTRAVKLTEAGRHLLPVLSDSLDAMAVAVRRVGGEGETGNLTVSLTPAFAARWLVPRLGGFQEAHPDIDVRLAPSVALVDFARDDVDLAIRYGRGAWSGVKSELLVTLDTVPVCSPALLDGARPLREPADLRNHVLLHDDVGENWRRWLVAVGVEGVDPSRGPKFGDENLMIQAAIQGQGVAVSESAIVAADIAAGRLVKPFDISLPSGAGYYLVYPAVAAGRRAVKTFRDWILAEARG
ncbi:MAG: transcriptional regulator GcvA [Alphaproteobacteria bacterium]|nr:transcriptional regulator GcvA [Alphaproteobacteria bacterium]